MCITECTYFVHDGRKSFLREVTESIIVLNLEKTKPIIGNVKPKIEYIHFLLQVTNRLSYSVLLI